MHRTRHIQQISKIQHIPLPQNQIQQTHKKIKKNKLGIIEHIK